MAVALCFFSATPKLLLLLLLTLPQQAPSAVILLLNFCQGSGDDCCLYADGDFPHVLDDWCCCRWRLCDEHDEREAEYPTVSGGAANACLLLQLDEDNDEESVATRDGRTLQELA